MTISVYITSYNQKFFLVEAIESILAQTLQPHEIIIVDDASNDASQEVIRGYASRYKNLIKPIFHTQNTGVAQTRVDALKAVTGDYVTYVDGDDRFLPTKLEKEVKLLDGASEANIVYSNQYYMTIDGIHTGTWLRNEGKPPVGDVFIQTFARSFPQRSIFRMEMVYYPAWKEVGFHDPNLRIYEDWDMRIRLTKNNRVVYVDEPLAEVRESEAGLSKADVSEHISALDYIQGKNLHLLNSRSRMEKHIVQDHLFQRRIRLLRKKARHELYRNNRWQAMEHYWQSLQKQPWPLDTKLLFQIIFPRAIVDFVVSRYRRDK